MTTATWSSVDGDTADLLSLVADTDHPSVAYEWDRYVAALHVAADADGRIDPNVLRPLIRGVVAPRRVGAFCRRAVSLDLVTYDGTYVISDDTTGRNAGRPARVLRLVTA